MFKKMALGLIVLFFIIFPQISFARTTPEDILNEQKAVYNQRVQNYSPTSKQKLESFSQKIANLNKEITDDYELNLIRQGDVLDEYISRNKLGEDKTTDGIHRNLSDQVENARYWLTYAHEAVAYQAAEVYVFNLTSESSLNPNILTSVNSLENDISILRGKVLKSQQIIATLVK